MIGFLQKMRGKFDFVACAKDEDEDLEEGTRGKNTTAVTRQEEIAMQVEVEEEEETTVLMEKKDKCSNSTLAESRVTADIRDLEKLIDRYQ